MGFLKLNFGKTTKNHYIKGLVKTMLWKNNLDERYKAAETLDHMDDLDKNADSSIAELLVTVIREAKLPYPSIDALEKGKLANSNRFASFVARRAISKMGETAIGPLVNAITGDLGSMDFDSKLEIRASLALILQNQASKLDPSAIDKLIVALQSSDQTIMSASAMVLGHVKDPKVTDALIGLLGDKSSASFGEVAAALGNIGDPRAIDPLIKAMLMGCASKEYAIALEKFHDLRAVQPLIDVLKTCIGTDYDYAQPSSIINALSALGDKRAIEPLSAFLSHHSTYKNGSEVTRSYLARALGHIGDGSVVAVLLRTMNTDPNESVQCEAAKALGELAERGQLGFTTEIARIGLKAFAETDSSSVREIANKALAKFPEIADISTVSTEHTIPDSQESSIESQISDIINDYSELAMIEEIAKILVSLDRKSNQEYNSSDKTSYERTLESIRTTGSKIYQEGGEKLMRQVLLQAGAYGCNMRFVEREWDGIGSWRG